MVVITLANDTRKEQRTKALLERILVKYDLERYIFTDKIVVEQGVISHSEPVLTINTLWYENEHHLLATFIHEQLHWFFKQHNEQVFAAIAELRKLFPEVPVGRPEGAKTEKSSYLHLLLNRLEFLGLDQFLGKDAAERVMQEKPYYTWIYEQILLHGDVLDDLLKSFKLYYV